MSRRAANQIIKKLRKAINSEDCFEIDAATMVNEFMQNVAINEKGVNEASRMLDVYAELYEKRVESLHRSQLAFAKSISEISLDDLLPLDYDPAPSTSAVVSDPEIFTAVVADPEVSAVVVADPEVSTAVVADPEVSTAVVADPEVSAEVVADPEISTAVVADPEVSAEVVADPEVSTAVVADPKVSAEVVADPEVSTAVVPDPEVSTLVMSDPDVIAAVVTMLGPVLDVPESDEHVSSLARARILVTQAESNQDPGMNPLREALLRALPYRWDQLLGHELLRKYTPPAVLVMSLMLASAGTVELVSQHGSDLVLRLRELGPDAGASSRHLQLQT